MAATSCRDRNLQGLSDLPSAPSPPCPADTRVAFTPPVAEGGLGPRAGRKTEGARLPPISQRNRERGIPGPCSHYKLRLFGSEGSSQVTSSVLLTLLKLGRHSMILDSWLEQTPGATLGVRGGT